MAEILLNEACTALSNKDFKPSLHALKEMYRPMEELKRYGKQRPDLSSKLEYFENEASTQTARTESLQAIDTGNEFKMIIFNFQGRSKIPLIRAVFIFLSMYLTLAYFAALMILRHKLTYKEALC